MVSKQSEAKGVGNKMDKIEKLLEGLNDRQRDAVLAPDGPTLVLSGAGSGKTQTLTRRIAYLLEKGVHPSRILAVTFTNKAAREMKERIEGLVGEAGSKIWIGTFHSICLRMLRSNPDKIGAYRRGFTIYDDQDTQRVIKDILKRDGNKLEARAVRGCISGFKTKLWSPNQALIEAENGFEKAVAEIYKEYQSILQKNNAMDFDDIIVLTVNMLETKDDVREKYQERFQYVSIDEYQDLNYAQYKLVTLLSTKHRNLFAVGDPDQTIYSFRGSNMQLILDFESDYLDATVVKMEQNYRCTQNILEVANQVIENNRDRIPKALWTENPKGDPVYFYNAFSDLDEARFVADQVAMWVMSGKYEPKDIAILYRTNFQSRSYEDALLRARINYNVVGNISFYERKEVKDLLAYLKFLINPSDAVSFKRIINTPKRGIGDTTVNKIEDFAEENKITLYEACMRIEEVPKIAKGTKKKITDFLAMMNGIDRNRTITNIFDYIVEITGYVDELRQQRTEEAEDRIDNINELRRVIAQFVYDNPQGAVHDFLQDLALLTDQNNVDEDGGNAVSLMTIHASKGLEFPIVFLTGLEEGLFPSSRAFTEDEIGEERRLFYVGITRAEEKLYITKAITRSTFGGAPARTTPSRFLDELPLRFIEHIRC